MTSALDFKARVDPLCAFSLVVILRFTSGATPADCTEVSMAAEPFSSTHLWTCPQALVGVRTHDHAFNSTDTYFSFSPFILIPSFSQERTLAGLEDELLHVITSSCPARGFFGLVVIDRDFGGTEGNFK